MTDSIKTWPSQERPRERLLNAGAPALSDAELLAIFLRSGSQQHSAVELARQMLQHFGSLTQLLNAPYDQVSAFHGIGPTKFVHLQAAKEMGRRYLHLHIQQRPKLNESHLIHEFLRYELMHFPHEVFACLVLDADLRFLHFKILFHGHIQHCQISINTLMQYALQQHAVHLVVAHTHPYADALPSAQDERLTQQLKAACQLLEIQLLDHFILAKNGYFSFAEKQKI